jgi:hypothetical protein
MGDFTKQDEAYRAYQKGFAAGVKYVTDNNVGKWISVKDRLPEIYEKEPDWSVTVLFRTIQGHIHSGYRNIGRPQKSFYDDDWTPPYWLDESENLTFEEDEVTHWQPMPQPPKGE